MIKHFVVFGFLASKTWEASTKSGHMIKDVSGKYTLACCVRLYRICSQEFLNLWLLFMNKIIIILGENQMEEQHS